MTDLLGTVNFAMTIFEFTAFVGVFTIIVSMVLFAAIVGAVGPKTKKISRIKKSRQAAVVVRKSIRQIPITAS